MLAVWCHGETDSETEKRSSRDKRFRGRACCATSSTDINWFARNNALVWNKHTDNVKIVMADPAFRSIMQETPLKINKSYSKNADSGFIEPFEKNAAIAALRQTLKYIAGINGLWVDPLFNCCPDVPITWSVVEALQKHYFREPTAMVDITFEVGVLQQALEEGGVGQSGRWMPTTPIEALMAKYAAMAATVLSGDEDLIAKWHTAELSTPCHFRVVDNKDGMELRNFQLRENMAEDDFAMSITPVQLIYRVIRKRKDLGTMDPDKVVEAYSGIQLSEKSEQVGKSEQAHKMNRSTIDMCFTAYDRALAKPGVATAVLEQEVLRHKSLFNGITKFQRIIDKAKNDENIEWNFMMMNDYQKCNYITQESCAVRALEGKLAGSKGKGTVDLFNFKKDVRDYLQYEALPKLPFSNEIKAKLVEACIDVVTFRTHNGWPVNAGSDFVADQSWRASCPPSADAFLSLFEDPIQDVL